MALSHASTSPSPPRRAARIPLLLLVAMVLASAFDRLVDGMGLVRAFGSVTSPAALAGLGTVAALGTLAARRESRAPCARLRHRLIAMVALLVCGLLVQELVALLLHAEHAVGVADLAAHAGTVVLPAAAACGVGVALAVGVAHAARLWPWLVSAVALAVRAAAPRTAHGRRDAVPHVGPLLFRHLAGRAPPVLPG